MSTRSLAFSLFSISNTTAAMTIVDFVKRSWRPICREGQRPGVRCRALHHDDDYYDSDRGHRSIWTPRFIGAVVSLSIIALILIISGILFLYRRRSFKKHLNANRSTPGAEGGVIFDSDKSADDENKPMLKKLRLGDRLRGKKEEPQAADPFSDKYKNDNPPADNPFDDNATPRPSFQSVGYPGADGYAGGSGYVGGGGYDGGGDARTSLDQGYQYGQSPYTAVPNNAP